MSAILPPDLELWLCGYLRPLLADVPDVQVGHRKPDDYDGCSYPLVTIRDDGGAPDGIAAFDRSLGVNVYGWSRSNDQRCGNLARRVLALLTDHATLARAPGSPIIGVDPSGCNGPYPVSEDSDTGHHYLTVAYTVIGQPL